MILSSSAMGNVNYASYSFDVNIPLGKDSNFNEISKVEIFYYYLKNRLMLWEMNQ